MLKSKIRVFRSHGKQYIKDLGAVVLPDSFRGCPRIKCCDDRELVEKLVKMCPTRAIGAEPLSIDLGRCVFCGECAKCAPNNIVFTNDFRMAASRREDLLITAESRGVKFDYQCVRSEVVKSFGHALKLREVSAGGDASCEMELNASMNVNFDFARYGVDFVASPRHADGVVITGPISGNMATALEICYDAIAEPKVIVVVGSDAIGGGVFADSGDVNRVFLSRHTPELYVPGNPAHPLTFIDGVLNLIGQKNRE